MIENFKGYLIEQIYSEYTPSGNPSKVYDYGKRIEKICERERIYIMHLADNIGVYVKKYDTFGSDAEFGKRSLRLNKNKKAENLSENQHTVAPHLFLSNAPVTNSFHYI